MTRIVFSGGRVFATDYQRGVCIELTQVIGSMTLRREIGRASINATFPMVEFEPTEMDLKLLEGLSRLSYEGAKRPRAAKKEPAVESIERAIDL